jgi:nucleoside-diphosphate-sugar epimerase
VIVALFGATSKTGRYVVAELVRRGHQVVACGRDAGRLQRLSTPHRVVVDLSRPPALPEALAGAEVVASLAHARFTATVLAGLPKSCRRVVLTGSLRHHTKLPDPAADAVRDAERLFMESGRRGVMLHPSMIYGAPDERNVNRILGWMLRLPRGIPLPVPLPGGGHATVQPVFVDDMVAAFVAAVERDESDGPAIAVAGPTPIPYRNFVAVCAAAVNRRVCIVPLSLAGLQALLRGAERLTSHLPITSAELARTNESKAFDIGPMQQRLGVTPRSLEEGLRLKIERGWYPGGQPRD